MIHITIKKNPKQQGNVYKLWLFVMVEFTFTSTFTDKCISSHKREVLDGCAMNSQLSMSSLSRLWINCAAEALTLCWHCAGGVHLYSWAQAQFSRIESKALAHSVWQHLSMPRLQQNLSLWLQCCKHTLGCTLANTPSWSRVHKYLRDCANGRLYLAKPGLS